jgi:predicted nucleic acid-binding protein
MGLRSDLGGQRVYLDTNIFIYALEGQPEFLTPLADVFAGIDQGELHAVTSELTLAEVLVKTFLDKSLARQSIYEKALQSSPTRTIAPVSRRVLVEAARLRATHSLKLPDAIHAATAHLMHCPIFLTNDLRLRSIPYFKIVVLSDYRTP